jgi:hypothetical protein
MLAALIADQLKNPARGAAPGFCWTALGLLIQ